MNLITPKGTLNLTCSANGESNGKYVPLSTYRCVVAAGFISNILTAIFAAWWFLGR